VSTSLIDATHFESTGVERASPRSLSNAAGRCWSASNVDHGFRETIQCWPNSKA